MFCRSCGSELNSNDKFCRLCGTPVSNDTGLKNQTISHQEYDFDISQFGNDKIKACLYVKQTYNLSLAEAKNIVDKKYDSAKTKIKEKQSKFKCTLTIGSLEIDQNNKLFKVIGGQKDAFVSKQKHGLLSNVVAFGTVGISRILENATNSILNSAPSNIYNFSDINSFELLEDSRIVTSGSLGTALAATFVTGSYQAGTIGAIVGQKSSKEINMMAIKLNMNDINNACVIIPLISKKTKTNSNEYKAAYNQAQQILSTLNVIANS